MSPNNTNEINYNKYYHDEQSNFTKSLRTRKRPEFLALYLSCRHKYKTQAFILIQNVLIKHLPLSVFLSFVGCILHIFFILLFFLENITLIVTILTGN